MRNLLTWLTRERFMFALGVGIAIWETTIGKTDRPSLWAAAVGLMGLPAFMKATNKDDE